MFRSITSPCSGYQTMSASERNLATSTPSTITGTTVGLGSSKRNSSIVNGRSAAVVLNVSDTYTSPASSAAMP